MLPPLGLSRLLSCSDLDMLLPNGVTVPPRDVASLLCHSLSCSSCFCAARLRRVVTTHTPPTRTRTAITAPEIVPDWSAAEEPEERTAAGLAVGAAIPLTLLDDSEHNV